MIWSAAAWGSVANIYYYVNRLRENVVLIERAWNRGRVPPASTSASARIPHRPSAHSVLFAPQHDRDRRETRRSFGGTIMARERERESRGANHGCSATLKVAE